MIAEKELVDLVNEYIPSRGVYLENYQKIDLYVYDPGIVKEIIKECKFKDVGNVYDYPDILSQPEYMNMLQLTCDFDWIERIAVSKKLNAVMNYSRDNYCIRCTVIIDTDSIKKFAKKVKPILKQDDGVNMFRDIDFSCAKGKYIEISNTTDPKARMIDVVEHSVSDETLVFDPDSVLNEVMDDIDIFFQEKTQELYGKLEIPYKRGVILHGEPGNGKSAMIREIIRITPDISKIIINPGVNNFTLVLSSLFKALDGKKAIIVIEDIETVIACANRSELLNVLDGINVVSGAYLIGTTNYPENIDPAFINRSGRFDRSYKIDNPTEKMRRLFFKSKKLNKILSFYKVYKDENKEETDSSIVDLFVQYSDGLPMANLKELVTSTTYMLAMNEHMTIEEAIQTVHDTIVKTRAEHVEAYNARNNYTQPRRKVGIADFSEY